MVCNTVAVLEELSKLRLLNQHSFERFIVDDGGGSIEFLTSLDDLVTL